MLSATLAHAMAAPSKHSIGIKKSTSHPGTPQSKNVKVGIWNLHRTEFTEIEAPENTELLFSANADESVIGPDGRKRVNNKDFRPGGKYRCELSPEKLFSLRKGAPLIRYQLL